MNRTLARSQQHLTLDPSQGDHSGQTWFCFRNRFALVRLSDMETFKAHVFSGIFRELRRVIAVREQHVSGEFDEFKEFMAQLASTCKEFELPMSVKQAGRAAELSWVD
ncbi:MAG: hypothetical protein V3T83_12185, partial [Acidobacteriota bacterium]